MLSQKLRKLDRDREPQGRSVMKKLILLKSNIQALSEAEPATDTQTTPADSASTSEPSASQPTGAAAATDDPSGQAIAASDAAVPASSGQTATEALSLTSSQPVAEDQEEFDEEKQAQIDGLIGQLIALSNQLRAVTNEIRALEKKVGANNADIQKVKEKVKTLNDQVQANKKGLLQLL